MDSTIGDPSLLGRSDNISNRENISENKDGRFIMRFKYLKNVVNLNLNKENCVGCGMCTNVCPHGVFEVEDNKAYIAEKDYCIECGACAQNCPVEAIEVKSGVG
tara:strand:- start:169 stop:480 length:312 start_codon:yes stop_codon:yes gene_type:complete